MKNLNFSKTTLARIQDDKLKKVIGADGPEVQYSNGSDNKDKVHQLAPDAVAEPSIQSCCKKSCNSK